ncbi:MAG TPA: OAM dimerization domain-containing protein [Solirubrobacteraceae bacterium]|nr:OAM dimerization domain-containing protein [Solirubrobacteraceae bacterium]
MSERVWKREQAVNGASATGAGAAGRREVDLARVKPYADRLDDGLMQLGFTLPVPYGKAARRAAMQLAAKMGLEHPEVVHYQALTEGYTYFVMFGECVHTVDFSALSDDGFEVEYMTEAQIEAFARERIGRPIVVVGAATGTDTHSVGIDAMLNLKGFHGHHGLEGYKAFRTHNLGSQVPNSVLVARAIDLGADAILVSQTVTQQNLHIANLTELVEIVEAEGQRKNVILTCGGPRVSDELAKELGYDAGFSKGTYPHHVASFIVRELAARIEQSGEGALAHGGRREESSHAPGADG